MSAVEPPAGTTRLVRFVARPGAAPVGAVFGGIGALAAAAIGLLHLDRLPLSFCLFKAFTGLPCPTCGSTRAVGHLFALDFAGAFRMNPVTTLVAFGVAGWAAADLVLMTRGRALGIDVSPRVARVFRVGALALFLANWVYLLVAGR